MITDNDYIFVDCVLHSEAVAKSVEGKLPSDVEQIVKSLVDKAWEQITRDALIGTFADFNEALLGKGSLAYGRLQKTSDAAAMITPEFVAADLKKGVLPFTLKLQAKWFKDPRIGLQHLVQVLCGDIFYRAAAELDARVEVKKVNLGNLREIFLQQFRGKSAHDIKGIRELFSLNNARLLYAQKQADLPLLAFSFKPRNGLAIDEFKRISSGVLRAGFNIVEMDVRNVEFMDPDWRKAFVEVAKEAVNVTTHVARFSLNLSGPAHLVIPYAEEFKAAHGKVRPWVVKVDGGLDGLSTIQAMRTHFADDQPVITCYPILGGPLQSQIGAGTFRDMLVLSGADIIYPGGAPRIGDGDFVDRDRDERGVRHYKEFLAQGCAMPSIAGGVHAGQLPAYYEIFGPEVCYFLGGGVALHLNGAFFDTHPVNNPGFAKAKRPQIGVPIKADQQVGGAELCRFAVEVAGMTSDYEEQRKMLAFTREHYVKYVEGQAASKKYEFVNPKSILNKTVRSFREKG